MTVLNEMEGQSRAARLMEQADVLASFSESETGLTRAYLTPQHRAAHDQISLWMQQAGLQTWQDSVGNQWGRKVSPNPTKPTLILGSHSDTVVNAGKYDGNLGVLLAIETLAALRGETFPFHIDVVAFADEEGTRFNTTLIGSSAVAGCFDSNWIEVTDANGVTMAQAMREFGLDPEKAGSDARQEHEVQAYLEAHIEQGPVLEAENLAVGVVTGIAGAKRFQCEVTGIAGHAGTVPVHLRQDAMTGAAEMILSIEKLAKDEGVVATVGKCEIVSGAVNVIAGRVRFTIDIRSASQSALENATYEMLEQLKHIAQQRKLSFEYENIYKAKAVQCNNKLQQKWASAIEKVTNSSARFLPSGAGHDAMVMADLTDTAMLFIRCEKGISHNPKEQVLTSDVEIGLTCFIEMIRSFNA
ncbi:allantoate amidohydrolase [Vibrio diazotrophicus]|uniref:allantoate amidohydrolase n=1 Tax=Vibrio diazotrophicus TaxID=685 RepID=UPI000C9EA960|nr:allantoate amidohydrolase [Vibrio diazotrophicus]PNH78912.1 allantoate amidohydrolase [Vibrio diazotrophicus]